MGLSTRNGIKSHNLPREDDRMNVGKFRSALFSMFAIWAIKYSSGMKSVISDAPQQILDLCGVQTPQCVILQNPM